MEDFVFIILASSFMSFISNLLFQKFFIEKGVIDEVKKRSSHKVVATRSGGLAVFSVIFLVSCFFYFSDIVVFDFSFLVPLSLLMLVGLYDDIYKIDFKLKFIFQIIAAKIIIDNGLIIDNLHGVLGINELGRITAQIITIFFIVAIINSINFIDGIDGLAISIVGLFIVAFEFFSNNSSQFLYLSIITISSILPIYYFNFKKRKKVFLGDSGSLFLGGIVSIYVIYILSQNYIIQEEYDLHKIIFVVSILFYPIVDIIRIVFKRIKDGKSPFEADKNHLHHRLITKVNNHAIATLIILSISVVVIVLFQILFG